MTPARMVLPALLGLFLVQLAVPAARIVKYEQTLSRGETFRFRCAPVDPADPLRGRYVALAIVESEIDDPGLEVRRGDRLYLGLSEDGEGYARFSGPRIERPDAGPYLEVRVSNVYGGKIRFDLPFDRYYLEEALAPAAEQAYRERASDDEAEAWITVRVRDGSAVLEELYLEGRPIREFLADAG